MTFRHAGDFRNFGLDVSPPYEGTSMATPHVSAGVAMIRALGVLGRNPTPRAIERHLKNTARDLGAPGPDRVYGAGLVDLDKATQRPSGSRR
jgi:serine protease